MISEPDIKGLSFISKILRYQRFFVTFNIEANHPISKVVYLTFNIEGFNIEETFDIGCDKVPDVGTKAGTNVRNHV